MQEHVSEKTSAMSGWEGELEAGGYENTFTSDVPGRLVCKLCHLPSRDPHLSVCCGHTFCKSCADWRRHWRHSDCPVCRNEDFSSVLNKQIDREVKALSVHCSNQSDGCTWRGQLKRLPGHRENCQFEWIKCEYHDVGCHEEQLRKDMEDHIKEDAEYHLWLTKRKLKDMNWFLFQIMMGGLTKSWSVQLDPLSNMMESGDQVCPVIVKVLEYARSIENGLPCYSETFYSHIKGIQDESACHSRWWWWQ